MASRVALQRGEEGHTGGAILTEITTRCGAQEWSAFLEKRGDARIYHTPQWSRFLQETFHCRPCHLFMRNESGEVSGLLPMFYTNSPITGKKLSCTPFSHLCGYIGEPFSGDALADRLGRMAGDMGAECVEVKGPVNSARFKVDDSFFLFNIDLTPGAGKLWDNLGKDIRRGVKKSKNNGVTVLRSNAREDVKRYYSLNCETKKRLGVPCHSWRFFENIFKYLEGNVALYLGEREGEAVSGLIMVNYGRFAESGYSAHNTKYSGIYPNNSVRWASIEDACGGGYVSYDMGRVYRSDEGLAAYKRRWGAVESVLQYSYYPEAKKQLANSRESIKYRAGTQVFRHLPLPIYKSVSELLFPYLG